MEIPSAPDIEAELSVLFEGCLEAGRNPGLPPQPAGYDGMLGVFPVYFPEEIAHAAGLLPVALLGGGNRMEMHHADARIGSFVCSICRSTTELALNGSMTSLKGFITHPICDAAKHLAGIWARNLPDQLSEILYLPQNVNTPGAAAHIADEYHRLLDDLVARTGRRVSEDSLAASIALYNKNRRLVRELYRIRRDTPWNLSMTECYLLLRARSRMSCEAHTELLERAIAALAARDAPAHDKPRVVLVGGFCEQPPLEMLEVVDDACYVVDDDLLIGVRWLTEDVAAGDDPIAALADAYVEHSAASPVQHDERKSKEGYLEAMLRESRAEAAILTAAKFCEPGLDEQLAWSKHLDRTGTPYLVLEFEEKMTSFEQMAMQIETFAESLLFSDARPAAAAATGGKR